MEIYYIDRKTGQKQKEIVAGEKHLKWLYNNSSGRFFLETVFKHRVLNFVYGKLQDLPSSSKKIIGFINDLSIDMNEALEEDPNLYRSFNDFFIRRLKPNARPINRESNILISSADGKILAYENIDVNRVIQVKGQEYSLEELLGDKELANSYSGGTCIVVRLAPADYHRFHFPDKGIPLKTKKIDGKLYSVNPIALSKIKRLYCQNKREITVFKSENFDNIIMIEVGATCVGTIVQTYEPVKWVDKGEEKGYFKFGGSTVILFIPPGVLKIDEDIIKNTQQGFETRVYMGEKIGEKK